MRSEHPTLRAALTLALTFTMLWGGMPVPALAEVAEEVIEVTEEAAAESEGASLGELEEVGASETGEVIADELLEEDSADVDEADTEPLESEEEAAIEEASPEAVEEGAEEPGAESADEEIVLEAQSAIVDDPRVVADSSMQAGQRVTWDCVWLGSYPQAVVTDAATVAALDAATGWSASGDLAYGGATYRRLNSGGATYSGYQSDFVMSPAGWLYFLWEPVKWRVLETDGSTALVVADVGLDDQRYNATYTGVTWETCGLRAWLNQTFRDDALTPAQQGAVVPQTLANDDNIDYGTPGGNPTTDQVFLLSESDVWSTDGAARHGFARAYGTYDEARRCKQSDYAHAMGAWRSTSSSYLGNCEWCAVARL